MSKNWNNNVQGWGQSQYTYICKPFDNKKSSLWSIKNPNNWNITAQFCHCLSQRQVRQWSVQLFLFLFWCILLISHKSSHLSPRRISSRHSWTNGTQTWKFLYVQTPPPTARRKKSASLLYIRARPSTNLRARPSDHLRRARTLFPVKSLHACGCDLYDCVQVNLGSTLIYNAASFLTGTADEIFSFIWLRSGNYILSRGKRHMANKAREWVISEVLRHA